MKLYRPVGAKELELIKQSGMTKFPPRLPRQAAPCQEVVIRNSDKPMLDLLPIIRCWPEDPAGIKRTNHGSR